MFWGGEGGGGWGVVRIDFGVIILPQHFYHKSCAKNCLLVGKKIILVLGPNYNHNNLPP